MTKEKTISELVEEGKYPEAYFRLCMGEEIEDVILDEEIRVKVEGTYFHSDKTFKRGVIAFIKRRKNYLLPPKAVRLQSEVKPTKVGR